MYIGAVNEMPPWEIYCTRCGLASSSPLRGLAIQTIDIFIRGCHLNYPETLHHFHFIFNPISTLFFCLVFFHLITEFELDVHNISSPRSQVRAILFCSFTIWLTSISNQPQLNKDKHKEYPLLRFPPWCHFYFVSHSIPNSFLFRFPFHFDYRDTWGVLQDFHKPLSFKRRFLTFHSRTLSFCCHPFVSLEPSKLFQNKFISSPP